MALHWNENLNVGYGLIDEQRKELLRRSNALLDTCREERGKETIASMHAPM